MMVIFSEIGDKTFLITAILAMRHSRLAVFAGAFVSLLVMSVLSAELGHLLPTLIPRKWTQISAGVLFLAFGGKMLMEAWEMPGGSEKIEEEMKEAEEEIEGDGQSGDVIPLERLEEGEGDTVPSSPASSRKRSKILGGIAEGGRNFCSLILGPVFVQSFVLNFLGEWGDRSQIATFALGATLVSFCFRWNSLLVTLL